MDGGAWWAAVHGVARSWTQLSDFTFTFHFHASEKKMATHSSVLAWRIPGTGEPGGLPSMGSHRVGHDWSDLAAAAAVFMCQSQFISPSFSLGVLLLVFNVCSLCLCLYFCFANIFACIVFLDSIYKWCYMIFVFLSLTCFTQCDSV